MSGFGKALFLVYATLLSVVGLFASEMFVPSLGAIQRHFQSDAARVGLSISIYMAGFAVAQLFYGALSDQVGRKPPLLVGLTLFLLGTLGCISAGSIEAFLAFRLVQAIGVGAAYVLWQPMVFDLFQGDEVQRLFARLMAVGSLSPALAPLLGGYMAQSLGWRSVFWLLTGLTVALLAWTALVYRESLSREARQPFSASKLLRQYAGLLRSRFFLGHAGAIGCGLGAYFAFLTLLPLVLSGLGYPPNVIGSMYLPLVVAFIVGAEIGRRVHPSLGDRGSCALGAGLGLAGAVILLASSSQGVSSHWQLVPPAMLLTLGNGFLVPTGTAYLIKSHPDRAGACASAAGFLVALMAFASTFLASLAFDRIGVLAMTGTMLLFALVMNVSLYWGRRGAQITAVAGG
ncbi:Bcr/CflA family efflux MFS transporter [Sorangium sp. So ce1036]|uniref:Bcr/CflA family efflux MFS transporter n=1 Tax=Sorangium sp. So ce1036 TaxID=3133328 RepID=UPI003F025C5C